jgi:ubiquinone/menaquinone biosynthesis C-methylase UbiE
MTMSYYDHIAQRWHEITGYHGGTFKKHVLNHLLIDKIEFISGRSIIELGAGNGYFMPLVLKKFSGQKASNIVISDQSESLLNIAKKSFWIDNAEYLRLDIRSKFPFPDSSFDLVLATMLFNETSTSSLKKALKETWRILKKSGVLLATITHPGFIRRLDKEGLLRENRNGVLTFPGRNGIRLPVVRRSEEKYNQLLTDSGFEIDSTDIFATPEVQKEKPALKNIYKIPLAKMYECKK